MKKEAHEGGKELGWEHEQVGSILCNEKKGMKNLKKKKKCRKSF